MLGSYDFCGHYEWTFAWLQRAGGEAAVRDYWLQAISIDSQRHARELILQQGVDGMKRYWGHTLQEESPDLGFTIHATDSLFRIDIQECPSKGFLLRNGLQRYRDYCDHCIGWIGPLMKDAGFVVDHEHNHRGQCWWEFRRKGDASLPSPPGAFGADDVRLRAQWNSGSIDRFSRANSPGAKETVP